MSSNPTHRYLIENSATLYQMREELQGLEPLLARDIRHGIVKLAERRKLSFVQEDVEEGPADATCADTVELIHGDLIDLHVFDDQLRLPSGTVVGVEFCADLESLLRRTPDGFITLDMSPLSVYLGELQEAKQWWFECGFEGLFARYPNWETYTNNRVPHTYWGARVADAPSIDLADLARQWELGKVEDAFGFVGEALDVYRAFANNWKKSITPRLGNLAA